MTTNCSSTTAAPFKGEVALGYWQTLNQALISAGLEAPVLNKENTPDNTITVAQYLRSLKKGIAGCEGFGLRLGASVSLKTFPVLGMTLLSCTNLHQVLNQILRYESLNHDLGRSDLRLGKNESHFSWSPNATFLPEPENQLCFHLALSVFAGIKKFAPLLIQRDLPIERVSFMAGKPANVSSYQAFFQADIDYQQPQNSVTFKNELLDWEVANGDASMFETLAAHADNLLLAASPEHNFVTKVKNLLPEALRQQDFRIESIAEKLNVSPRTLQRKLKEIGHSYQGLLDETRKRLAEKYLVENALSMNEITFLIGYQEQSSFNHAFKNWTGTSPREYRDHHKTGK